MSIEVKISVKPIDYIKSVNILEQRVRDVLLGKRDELLWILEHNPVYTAGTSSKNIDLLDKKLKVIKTNRGGKHTYHGPGQKIVYFVLDLNKREKDIRKLVNKIENCIIAILEDYKIKSYPDKKNIGIWVNHKNNSMKIAAIGIRVKKWIAYHGFSVNINNNLNNFNKIVPCGLKNKKVISLKEISKINYTRFVKVLEKKLIKNFSVSNYS